MEGLKVKMAQSPLVWEKGMSAITSCGFREELIVRIGDLVFNGFSFYCSLETVSWVDVNKPSSIDFR